MKYMYNIHRKQELKLYLNLKLIKIWFLFKTASSKLTKCPFLHAQCSAVFPDLGSLALMNWG